MDTTSLAKRSKVKNLPNDLRGIAEAMLREKFPDDYIVPSLSDLFVTQTNNQSLDLTFEKMYSYMREIMIKDYQPPSQVIISPSHKVVLEKEMINHFKYETAPEWLCNWDKHKCTLMGIDVATNSSIAIGDMVFMGSKGEIRSVQSVR